MEYGLKTKKVECYLALRGLKTLHLRMEACQKNAMKIAEFLEGHEMIEKVIYPGLKSYEYYKLAMMGKQVVIIFSVISPAGNLTHTARDIASCSTNFFIRERYVHPLYEFLLRFSALQRIPHNHANFASTFE